MVASGKSYQLPLKMTLTNFHIKGTVHVAIHVEARMVSITLENDPIHHFQLTSNFDVIASAGQTLRDKVTQQIRAAITDFVSKPQTFVIAQPDP